MMVKYEIYVFANKHFSMIKMFKKKKNILPYL